MTWILVALAVWLASGVGALAARSIRRAGTIGSRGAVAGGLVAAVPVAMTLLGYPPASLHAAWAVPYGSFSLGMDDLSAFFMVPLLILAAACAVFGRKYLEREDRPTGSAWFFYNLLVASMVAVVTARNGILFLIAWEVMALVSFFLVVFHSEHEEVRRAGWIYLVATHLGSVFLLPMFILLGQASGSLDFDHMGTAAGVLAPAIASAVFVLALIGFGAKAGFLGLHVWLPEAHPAAPSHVSALMSGIMIKLGIYGLLRVLILLGRPAPWWGWTLMAIGLGSGIFGVLLALAQRDLKRMLAYSSVENMGIVTLGIGMGLVGVATGQDAVAVLGFAGALLHVLNHAMFKGLMFLGAGTVQHATGTLWMDRLGALYRHMPRTAGILLIGVGALAGLPPLNGFVGEFALFLGALGGQVTVARIAAAPFLAVIAGLALIAPIASACFSRAYAIVFLGTARTLDVQDAHDPGLAMLGPMATLAALCVGMGLGAPLVVLAIAPVVATVTRLPVAIATAQLATLSRSLLGVDAAALGVAIGVLALGLLRRRLLAGRAIERRPTWGCGYGAPNPRMQYTSAAFAMPLVSAFNAAIRNDIQVSGLDELFPVQGAASSRPHDIFAEDLFGRAYRRLQGLLGKMRWIQHGNLQVYVLYIALTLLVLLVWKLGI